VPWGGASRPNRRANGWEAERQPREGEAAPEGRRRGFFRSGWRSPPVAVSHRIPPTPMRALRGTKGSWRGAHATPSREVDMGIIERLPVSVGSSWPLGCTQTRQARPRKGEDHGQDQRLAFRIALPERQRPTHSPTQAGGVVRLPCRIPPTPPTAFPLRALPVWVVAGSAHGEQ